MLTLGFGVLCEVRNGGSAFEEAPNGTTKQTKERECNPVFPESLLTFITITSHPCWISTISPSSMFWLCPAASVILNKDSRLPSNGRLLSSSNLILSDPEKFGFRFCLWMLNHSAWMWKLTSVWICSRKLTQRYLPGGTHGGGNLQFEEELWCLPIFETRRITLDLSTPWKFQDK